MANTNNNSARQTHVSPGIYTKEVDLSYASKSLGITTLGVAGETLKGPAFQPILIENWRQYQTYFGGTDTTKFKGSQYPKYELPYIAKTNWTNGGVTYQGVISPKWFGEWCSEQGDRKSQPNEQDHGFDPCIEHNGLQTEVEIVV